jgi:hypothetical protein
MIDTSVILEDLKEGKDPRTKKSLDTLNHILKAYHEGKNRDFSITHIGRISSENGGPGYASLRATKNDHFRRLIEAWATYSGTTTKKPLAATARSHQVPTDHKLLERIQDVAVRALFGQILAERNSLKKQINVLKQHANIVIDRRPVRQFDAQATEVADKVELLPAVTGILKPLEVKALIYAISDECKEDKNWEFTRTGQVKDMSSMEEIFPRGFVTGIRKILDEVKDD